MVMIQSVRGMNDLFAQDLINFQRIETAVNKICKDFGYQEIRTPILEDIALFKRGVGETTDIVEKEMFIVEDGEHTYCLRPENTAPVVRALIERGINEDSLEKLFYLGPMFRKERPQKGRLRQFHQFGMEIFGVLEPTADIEMLVMVHHLLELLEIKGVTLKLNSLGSLAERIDYRAKLTDFLQHHLDSLCSDCKRRVKTNPLRVLDCKNQTCQKIKTNAPKMLDCIGPDSRDHFDKVLVGLKSQRIDFVVDDYLVRGLDYYNKTVFEFVADIGLGSQNTIIGGGRYDGLFTTLGHKIDLPAIGCAGGIERIAMLLPSNIQTPVTKLALIFADDESMQPVMSLAFELRTRGINTDFCLTKKSLKAQMRRADRLGAQFVGVIGEQERLHNRITIKGLTDKSQTEIPLSAEAIEKFFS